MHEKAIVVLTILNIVLAVAHLLIDDGSRNFIKRIRRKREEDMDCSIAVISGVPAGQTVYNGFGSGTCTAPKEEGLYTLYELIYPGTNTHKEWKWMKGVFPAVITYEEMVRRERHER